MQISPFKVEEWMNEQETKAIYNLGETCVDSLSLAELGQLAQVDTNAWLQTLATEKLTYGHIMGHPQLKAHIATLYQAVQSTDILTTHGAIGANHLVLYSLVEASDEVVAVLPTYQQLYAIPTSFHATVKTHTLTPERNFLPNIEELAQLVTPKTKVIILNNPNNPAGSLMDEATLQAVVDLARQNQAYILCDETYRGLEQATSESCPSIIDLYERGISVSSMSKVFSLAGLRLGWLATKDMAVWQACASHRDHTLISCGLLDEKIATLALENKDLILARNHRIIRENLAILDAWVQKEPHITYVKPVAGTVTLLYYDLPIASRTMCLELMNQHGLLFTPGNCFEFDGCVRIGYACETEMLKAGLEVFSRYLAEKARTS